MKILIVLFALAAVSKANLQWEMFKVEHKKLYSNPIEERTRFAIFQQNLKEIEEHNKLFKAGLVSWEQGITPFTDWTKEEFAAYLNQGGEESGPLNATPFVPNPSVQAPTKKNWVAEGKVSGVKNQGACGSCWSFAATGAIESQLLIKGQNTLLSEQQLVDCSTKNSGCSGGLASWAFEYIKEKGIETESDYPYTARTGTCQYDATKAKVKVSGYSEAHAENLIIDLVGTKGPTAVSIDGTHIQNYKSGVFDSTTCTMMTNHAVLVVGYDNQDGKDYWLVKNSWGTSWGENGYFKLVRGKNMCNIAKRAYVPAL